MSRTTIQQTIIGDTVKNMTSHPSSDEVFKQVNKNHPNISRATVYRVLNKLSQLGEIQKLTFPNTADRFDFRTDEHLHLRCKYCNSVTDIDLQNENFLKDLKKIIELSELKDYNDFKIEGFNISIEGICKNCQDKKKTI